MIRCQDCCGGRPVTVMALSHLTDLFFPKLLVVLRHLQLFTHLYNWVIFKQSHSWFPLSKPSVLKEWLENIGREDLQPKKHMVICSHHFTPDCFSSSGNRKNLLWNAVPTLFTSPPPNAKRRKCRKRIKCKAAHVLPKWEQLLLKVPGSESEKEGLGENAAGINNAMEEHQSSALQHLPPIDHNYALPSRCAARTRLFSAMDTIGWLHRKLKVKCQELQRMRLKLCACRKELANFRGRCLVSARLRFDQNGVA